MKKISAYTLLAILLAILTVSGYRFTNNESWLRYIFYAVDGFFISLFLVSAGYDTAQQLSTTQHKRKVGFWGMFLVVLMSINFLLLYAIGFCYEIWKSYSQIKPVRYVNQFLQADEVLGIKNKPGAIAYLQYEQKIDTIFFNSHGLRVSGNEYRKLVNGHLDTSLFIGCSFTFGFFCPTNTTYPELLCQKLNTRCYNGGTNSFGLAQMNIFLQQLFNHYSPKRVFVQYSSWLPWRSKLYYLPISNVAVPNPYYIKKNDSVLIQKPLFTTSFYNLNLPPLRVSLVKFIYLSINEIIPFYIKELFQKIYSTVLIRLHILPFAHNDLKEIEKTGYTAIYDLCRKNGAIMYLIALGNRSNVEPPEYLAESAGYCFINADSALLSEAANTEEYEKKFCHNIVQNGDTITFDKHLNPYANLIISNIVYEKVKNHEAKYANR